MVADYTLNVRMNDSRAGAADVFAQTCSGLCTDLIAEPSNYDTAYFELRSIKTYTGAPTSRSITSATQVNSTSTSGTGSNASSGNGGTGGGARDDVNALLALVAAGVAAFAM